MNRLLIITILVFVFGQISSQTVEIGQDAESVKRLIEWSTNEHNKPDSFGNYSSARVSSDVQYNNGVITDVIQCYKNQFYVDLRLSVDFCKHYLMEKGKLANILTQYENVSLETLIESYNKLYGERKQADFYFEEDYKHYSKIYLAKNGLATIEWKNVELSQIPSNIREEIKNKQKAKEEEESRKNLAAEEESRKNEEITLKVYDLYQYNRSIYNAILNNLKEEIKKYFQPRSNLDYFQSGHVPAFSDIDKLTEKKYRSKNTYKVYCKLEDQGFSRAGSQKINRIKEVILVSGTDKTCSLFNNIQIRIPTIEIEGNEVMTEARFENISIDYARGITEVKFRKENIEFSKFAPDTVVIEKIRENLRSKTISRGNYRVYYDFLNVMGEETIFTYIEH